MLAWNAWRTDPARPALWRVSGPNGQTATLFGTIHALPRPAAWQGGAVDQAMAASNVLVVEIAALNDGAQTARVFHRLSQTPGLPPLDQRVTPALRPALLAALHALGKSPADFSTTETWAAALTLAQGEKPGQSANGIDQALLRAPQLPVYELEGAEAQLAIFDRLPEPTQRRLLELTITPARGADLSAAWRAGDMAAIEAQTHQGIMADPAIRQALYAARNHDWAGRIAVMMRAGRRPFVAVGAAHMAGAQGLPALLTTMGYRVTRVQ
ncbi:TraB/GumN family protein [Novosphingobium sp. FSY-8]|uniref:TraB/GumN family protein n=2 Tax=Novosphingobium ovatum TaxID=1908523 RepID=A0ABW9XCN6_9SPHN|nr:TraB/GumN family protein [Novosphingobium ovatum]